ncbi:transcriptional activator DEMETER [Vicia villosa]|uniref:transcriptional activator DEMETER n=1 Tax=Vicia villosa TaxID=3911 RepID=UPI00273BA89B|nr:transcriptional activator DEMETER [Vicia villosa]XP_058770107.1 transcriptional activator DEMETER [Vicia villosa]XP_058770108.1 transcriptional activator DEMETER [Vicia villosa]
MNEQQQNNRTSIMNFGEQLWDQDGNQFQINNTWVPITPEKPIQIRTNTISDWSANQMRTNYQEYPLNGNDYMNKMLLHYHEPYQNPRLIGQTGQIGEYNNFSGNSVNRNSVVNHIAESYTRAQHYENKGLNNHRLELLLKKNATDIATANRNLDTSINMAASNPLLPKFYPKSSSDVSYSCEASDNVYREANRFLIPNRNSEFRGCNTDNLLNNDIHCSVSNQMKGIFSDASYGDTYPEHYFNYVQNAEVDATTSFTNSLQSTPKTMDQLEFVENQFVRLHELSCDLDNNAIAESTSHGKDFVPCTENEIQEYCDGLLQQIVDSSSAVISTLHGDQKSSVSNICDKVSTEIFDLNKTPEQKVPRRRKHRPKVIREAKPKRNTNPASQKIETKDKPRRKRKIVAKTAATPEAGVIKDVCDSTAATTKSCRRALNFDLENSTHESQSSMVFQQEIYHINEKAFNTTSDYKVKEMHSGASIKYDPNSPFMISQQDDLAVGHRQPSNTDDIPLLLKGKESNPFFSERESTITLSETTEKHIAKFPVIEKGPAQGKSSLWQERNSGCMQQYISANEIGNTLFQSETCFENTQETGELIFENMFQLLNNHSNPIEAKGSKRKYSYSTKNQLHSSRNPPGASLCQEILQVDGNFKSTTLAKGFLKKNKRKRTQNKLHSKVRGGSSSQIKPKDDSRKVRKAEKIGFQSHNEETTNCCIESSRFVEKQTRGVRTGDSFAISGERRQIYPTLMDSIICQLNSLHVNGSNTSEMEEQKALVPYKGDGSIVPYQEFEFEKKRKPRPKVDLDPETERTWKLLMGIEGSEDLEGADKKKEKWWEEERNVFRGRADSFIARMHLVQGDRRFSKWKGSVVDSVIGVFLTQNVSDHLSSSAFMSLAARFPLKSKSSDVVTHTLVEEPQHCIENQAGIIGSYERGKLNPPTYYIDFEMPRHTEDLLRDSKSSRINESLIKPNNHSSEEEFLSSQDSLDSSVTQDTRIRSNSESELRNSGCEHSKAQFLTSTNSQEVGITTIFQEFYHSVNGVSLIEERTNGKLQQHDVKQSSRVGRNDIPSFHSASGPPCSFGNPKKQQPPGAPSTNYESYYSYIQGLDTFQINGEEFSWPDTLSIHNEFQDNSYMRFGINGTGESVDKPTEMQHGNGTLGSPELPTMNSYRPLSKYSAFIGDTSQSRSHTNYNQPSPNHHLVSQKTFQSEGKTCAESSNNSHICGEDHAGNDHSNILTCAEEVFDSEKIISTETRQVCSDNIQAEKKAKKRVSPGQKDKEGKLKVRKERKTKPEANKKHEDDWDKLRKVVEENGTKIERNTDTMDSLDYEAIRCASVKEISDAIKERGMNNMLAERIKEFLNRLVREHGSIDLEWLRHAPPDKVKDYLLSMRGLGLKSVECVRLLTLHHLAFPVDTNVGRIAVRLGWVPLQPLPEKLQIHLLELYPVLESIQKYLWPRLCKLDQRTLYELHYQMITFGKVFCTKKKPNCNACPMRAECRHFASAFASARLALPGPEEKQIVSMPVPIADERNPPNLNPVILPLPGNNTSIEVCPQSRPCEPIIEEPATPEQSMEALESDIEDFFWEDPDEIPTINVNLEVFAKSLQNHMQEHEGDQSKALVAWNPQSASIPTPKLKNVSRLRTEHQVYELPDSHPLLEKMDKREPDDPSPYLLAIWSPGETANSIEPPQSKCGSQDSTSLCNDNTCFSCNSIREANSQIVRGTILIPCRTATRGSFPLNGTYFQVNELFADHASSIKPIDIPRAWIWNLPRRTVYFGTSVSSIFKGLSTQEIQHCFWRGFVCVRGFDQQKRAPRPLFARFHFIESKFAKTKK